MFIVSLLIAGALVVGGTLYMAERRSDRQKAIREARERELTEIRAGRPHGVMARLRERAYTAVHPFEQIRDHQHDRYERLEQHRDDAWKQAWHGQNWSTAFTVVVVAFAFIWALLFLLQRAVDVQILASLGYAAGSAAVLGTLMAVVFATAGVVVTGLLGLHPILPPHLKSARRSARFTVGLVIASLLVGLMLLLTRTATYRSIDRFGSQVSTDTKILAQIEGEPEPDPVEVATAKRNLTDALQRLRTGEQMDRTLTITVPAVEMLLGAAPVYAGELAVAGVFAVVACGAKRKEDAAKRKIAQIRRRFSQEAAELLIEGGVDPRSIEPILGELDIPVSYRPAGSPPTIEQPRFDGSDPPGAQREPTSPPDPLPKSPSTATSVSAIRSNPHVVDPQTVADLPTANDPEGFSPWAVA